jgi:hypothetical protein
MDMKRHLMTIARVSPTPGRAGYRTRALNRLLGGEPRSRAALADPLASTVWRSITRSFNRSLPSPAETAAVGAVVAAVALGAGATSATATLLITGARGKDGRLTGSDIKHGSLTSKELSPSTVSSFTQTHTNSVTSGSVLDGSLQAADLSATARASLKGAQGPKGDRRA